MYQINFQTYVYVPEAVARWSSVKKVSWKFQEIHMETPVPGSFFNEVAGLRPANLLKKRLWLRCFPVNTLFHRTPPVAASEVPVLSIALCLVWLWALVTFTRTSEMQVITIYLLTSIKIHFSFMIHDAILVAHVTQRRM